MINQAFIEGFRKSTTGKNEKDGDRVLRNDLVSDISYETSEDKIVLTSSVISENLFSEYSCKLDIDKKSKQILFSHCSCDEFEKRASSKTKYCCKHIVATFYKFIGLLDTDTEIKTVLGINEPKENLIKATQSSILDFLLGESKVKKQIKFEIIFNKITWSNKISAEFKIGSFNSNSNKLYSLKDIDSFLIAISNRIAIPYGKDFTFNLKEQKFTPKDKRLIKFIELLKEMDLTSNSFKKNNEKLVSGKQIIIPKALLKQFMTIAKDFRVYLGSGFYSRQIETEILACKIPIPMGLKEIGSMIKLEAKRGVPESFGESDEVFLYDTIIYIPPEEQIETLYPYIEAFNHGNTIFFTKDEETRVLEELIPSMQKITSLIELSPSLSEKVVVAPVNFKFYFDKDDEIYLRLEVSYDKYQFNYFDTFTEKVIYRDNIKEEEVIKKIREFGFEAVNNVFMFFKDESYIFKFFKEDILELQSFGEVYYSDRFTGIKNATKSTFNGQIKKGKYDYFEMDFSIGDIDNLETTEILRAFRDSKKFFRLKSGEFLDLEEIELKKFLKLLESLEEDNNIEDGKLYFSKSKGMYVADYLDDTGITYIKGKRELNSLRNTLKNLKSERFPLSKNINATLRNYQKEGFCYLKSLDYLGFGGILGDEMGLGKTLQAITFLASNEGSKTLIVAPTSLMYNWLNEFNKFAPSIKVALSCGDKKERHSLLKEYDKYDVFITTYNLLKRDIEEYEKMEFTYCILDEAQNIKNPSSLNAKAAKTIKAKTRFALTGTPLENSLMELWSIFDFIMPNYLYNQKVFETRYHRRLEEDDCIIEDLTRLIKPFILRRYKKDVLKELPDKIEKKLLIPMNKEQIKVYETYANYAKSLIENKVKDEEFKNSKIEILSYITKLRQICLDPSVVMDNYKGGSGKIEAVLETVIQSIDEGHKILLFSQFTSVLKNIAKLFKDNDVTFSYLDGSTPTKSRGKLVDDFNNSDTSVFLISLKAGGTGLNLTSADVVIHFDPWWNPAVEDQATDRAHRIGQNNVVEVIKMISQGTIEEKIIDLQEQKKDLINKVIGDEFALGDFMTTLSENDVMSLFNR